MIAFQCLQNNRSLMTIAVTGNSQELVSCHSKFCGKDPTSDFSYRARQPIIHLYRTASVFGRCSFSELTSVTPTEISNQPRRPGSRMSARFNVTRSSSDSQTYPPFAVQVDSETSKDRDQFHWSRSFAFGSMPVGRSTILLHAVVNERIGERHASACRYKNEVPDGSRRSVRRTHFWPREVKRLRDWLSFRTPKVGNQSPASEVICRSWVPAANTAHWFSVREHRKSVQSRWASRSQSA